MTMRALLLALLFATVSLAHAAEAPELVAALNETVFKLPVSVHDWHGKTISGDMVVTQYTPAGAGPFPIAVLIHGRAIDRTEVKRFRYLDAASYFVRRGFAVWVPTRLGYGDSGSADDPEASGGCTDKSYLPGFDAAAAATLAVIDYAKQQSFADSKRVLVLGQSFGGATAIDVAARQPAGLFAAINFAGGAGGDPAKHAGQPCQADRLQATYAGFGATARVPTLWIYTQNDQWMGATEPQRWFEAYSKAGGTGRFIALPAFGDDGHMLFSRGFGLWRPLVDDFLAQQGFAAPVSVDAPPTTSFATLGEVQKVPLRSLDARERYVRFLQSDVPRAFAVGSRGEYAYYSGPDSTTRALARCREVARTTCQLYAVDDRIVWPVEAAATPPGTSTGSTP